MIIYIFGLFTFLALEATFIQTMHSPWLSCISVTSAIVRGMEKNFGTHTSLHILFLLIVYLIIEIDTIVILI